MRTRDLEKLADRYRREIELREKDLALIEGEIAERTRKRFGFVLPYGDKATEEVLEELKTKWWDAPKGLLWALVATEGGNTPHGSTKGGQ